MKPSSDVTACVVDHGLFLPIAQKLGTQFKKVYWWSPHERTMRCMAEGLVGDGFETIERVDDIWSVKKECDLFVFPDIGFSGLQKELSSQGYPVWGHHGGDVLETNRGMFLKTLKDVGLEVPSFVTIKGLSALQHHLLNKEDKYIKISKWRGDWETLHWRNWKQDESTLDSYAYHLGPAKELITFYVFDPIDTDIEDGLDMYCIDGKFPSTVMHGMEAKDRSYLCSIQKYEDVPEKVRMVSDAFAPALGKFGYRGFFSFETRIKDEHSFFIDPTCRAASPPSQVMTELYGNLGDIIWHGANGELVDPDPTAQFGGQILLSVHRDKEEWVVLDIPDSLKDSVKCGFACEIDGRLCIPPHELRDMIGWLTATGETIAEVVELLKKKAAELPDGVDCDVNTLASLLAEVRSAEEKGMEFTDQKVPQPSIVVDT